MHGRVYSRMPEQFLHLFDRHALVDGVRGQSTTELMWMDSIDAGVFAEPPEAAFDAADADTVAIAIQSDE